MTIDPIVREARKHVLACCAGTHEKAWAGEPVGYTITRDDAEPVPASSSVTVSETAYAPTGGVKYRDVAVVSDNKHELVGLIGAECLVGQ